MINRDFDLKIETLIDKQTFKKQFLSLIYYFYNQSFRAISPRNREEKQWEKVKKENKERKQ